jgi:hypothetical protein
MLYGTDPEVFACTKMNNRNFVVSPALLEVDNQIKPCGGNIKHPVYIDKEEFSWMMDGVAFELTVKRPLNSAKEMHSIINNSLDCLNSYISKLVWNGEKLKVVKKPVVFINSSDYIENLENEKIYQGFIFGCDADEDGIETEYNCEISDVLSHPFRYGGGHIHFSGNKKLYDLPRPSVQLLALFVGNFCVANSPYPALERMRAETYGKPGRYRQQIYPNGDKGLEYRTPSNSWISYNLNKMEELFNIAERAVSFLDNFDKGLELIKEFLPDTIKSIKNADKNLANKILQEIS